MNEIKRKLLLATFFLCMFFLFGLIDVIIFFYFLFTKNIIGLTIYIVLATIQFMYGKYIPRIDGSMYFLLTSAKEWFTDISLIFLNGKIKDEMKKKDVKLLMCHHPHGTFGISAGMSYLELYFEKINVRAFTHNFIFLPLILGISARLIGLESIDAKNFSNILKNEKGVMVMVPGGGEEMLFTKKGEHKFYLKDRKGFIKYAIRYGYDLLPVYCFGDTEVYRITSLRDLLPFVKDYPTKSKLKFYISSFSFFAFQFLFVRGYKGIFNTVPIRKPCFSFAGDLIKIKKMENPPNKVITKYHKLYIEKLMEARESGIKMMKKDTTGRFKDVNYGKVMII